MAEVRLVDLDVIKRYSLAIRMESAPAEEVLAALDASREVVLDAIADAQPRQPRAGRARTARTASGATARRAPAKKARGA